MHRLAARYLDVRRTWRENQGDELVTLCAEARSSLTHSLSTLNLDQAAKLHPCLYDYDAFWPVHDHLKRHLVSTRDKYSYLDPDLVALYDAEAAARGEARPSPRKKRRTISKNDQCSAPRSPSLPPLSIPTPDDLTIDVDQFTGAELLSDGQSQPTTQHNLDHPTESPVHRASLQQSLLQQSMLRIVQRPQQPRPQPPRGRFSIAMGSPQAEGGESLMTLIRSVLYEEDKSTLHNPARH